MSSRQTGDTGAVHRMRLCARAGIRLDESGADLHS